MTQHYLAGDNLETFLAQVDDPQERALLIDAAYNLLGSLALEPVVVDELE